MGLESTSTQNTRGTKGLVINGLLPVGDLLTYEIDNRSTGRMVSVECRKLNEMFYFINQADIDIYGRLWSGA